MIPQKLRIISICTVIILLVSGTLGCTLFNDSDNEDDRKGFSQESLLDTIPDTYCQAMPTLDPKPVITASEKQTIGNIITSWYLRNTIYTSFGGAIKIYIQNNGTFNLYIYRIGIKPTWYIEDFDYYSVESGVYTDVGKYVNASDNEYIGMLYFPGPPRSGEFEYSITFSVYQQNETGTWNDCGVQEGSSKSFYAADLPTPSEYEQHYNLPQYYDKINGIVDPTNEEVINKAHQLAGKFSGSYNIYQVCSIFDYVSNNINYVSDPSHSENYWSLPEQTLRYGGDCEDFSTLLASMIISIGGSVRMYLTDSHAFIALYIGDEANIQAITTAIRNYYHSEVYMFWFEDKLGCWLIIDSGGSFYVGGLPLGSVPVKHYGSGSDKYSWTWDFTDTENLYIIDVKPK